MLAPVRRFRSIVAILLALLIACGGGDDGGPTEPDGSDGIEAEGGSVTTNQLEPVRMLKHWEGG